MIDFKPHPLIAPCKSKYDPAVHTTWYAFDYEAAFRDIARGEKDQKAVFRYFIRNDLFFVAYFVMENPLVNHPFGVNMCRMVQDGAKTKTLDVWARGHLKSWIITQAETVQSIAVNPEETHVIFSYKKPKAEDFLSSIKRTLEKPLMYSCFPEILYENPERESPSWSIQNGIMVKRTSVSRKEKTVETYGVIEGMPTGGHWDRRVYDDIETADLAKNPEQLQVLIQMFDYSKNLGAPGGRERIIGTYYSHCGLLVHLKNKKNIHGEPMYQTRIVPATDNGKADGKPVFLSQEELDDLKTDRTFNSQQLCNPTPDADIKLDFKMLQPIDPRFLPKNRIKFVIIDPAGDDSVQTGTQNDSWAMLCLSVEMSMDEMGNSRVFLEDIVSDQMALNEAVDAGCLLYMRNGRIHVIGVEKTANDTTYEHIRKGLKARGRHVEIVNDKKAFAGGMVLLSPSGRKKERRIEAALSWPLSNGKLFYSTAIDQRYIDMIEEEMNKFPYFHVDILDAWAYLYDLLTKYEFMSDEEDDDEDSQPTLRVITGKSRIGGY